MDRTQFKFIAILLFMLTIIFLIIMNWHHVDELPVTTPVPVATSSAQIATPSATPIKKSSQPAPSQSPVVSSGVPVENKLEYHYSVNNTTTQSSSKPSPQLSPQGTPSDRPLLDADIGKLKIIVPNLLN